MRQEKNIPKTLKGYSPEALEECGDLEIYKWAFRDLWEHDEQKDRVLLDRIADRDREIEGLKAEIANLKAQL